MTGNEIRTRFLEHFASREHLVLPSAPLVPQGDPSTLFISAGMQPLQPYYLGLSRPPAPRLASSQKCLRTGDIGAVGKTDRHNTFFEMLGNFTPTGDYFKETAIPLAWELVTQGFHMPVERRGAGKKTACPTIAIASPSFGTSYSRSTTNAVLSPARQARRSCVGWPTEAWFRSSDPRSTPGWGWSGSPTSCKARTTS